MQVAIVGLGLMGGSFGLALRKSFNDFTLLGFDHNEKHCQEAIKCGLVDEIVTFNGVKNADIIILAIPVEGVIASLEKLQDISSSTTIIDLGSTKAKIVENTPIKIRENLVAAHPMAGTEKFGPLAAVRELYKGQTVVLCDTHESGKLHLDRAVKLFTALEMHIVYMGAKEHDLHAAYISHLPHAISYALANSVLKQEDPKSILALAAGGFRDMSRIAKSSPHMWVDIFQQNRENLLTTIGEFEKEISYAKELIKDEKWEALEAWMQEATTLHKIL
jgi:prephenate dehydrogenase